MTVAHQHKIQRLSHLRKKPRHTIKSREEATRRERLRVQEIREAYRTLETTLKIKRIGRPKYLQILQTAIAYIRYLADKLGIQDEEEQQNEVTLLVKQELY